MTQAQRLKKEAFSRLSKTRQKQAKFIAGNFRIFLLLLFFHFQSTFLIFGAASSAFLAKKVQLFKKMEKEEEKSFDFQGNISFLS